MIIIKLSDQLGNQMFAYAMAKSLSLRKGYKLGVNVGDSYYQNSVDKKYGDTLPGVFSSIASEVVFPIGGGAGI